MNPPQSLLETIQHVGSGYKPLIDFGAWRVAVLGYSDHAQAEFISSLQRHNQTDEVFVLLQGRCILFVSDGIDNVGRIYAAEMQPLVLYNVKQGVWHNHVLSQDARVLIIENRDTSRDNSDMHPLSIMDQAKVKELAESLWV